VSHAIEVDFFVLVAGKMKHLHGQQFERAQQFSAAFEQQGRIRAGEFHQNLRTFPVTIVGHWRVDGDAVFELEPGVLHHRAEKSVQLVCGLNFVHKKLLASGS